MFEKLFGKKKEEKKLQEDNKVKIDNSMAKTIYSILV